MLTAANQCSVCLIPVKPGDAFTDPSGCGHLLHLPCFMQAHANMHSLCPTCRAPFGTKPARPQSARLALPAAPSQRFVFGSNRRFAELVVPPEEPLNFSTDMETTKIVEAVPSDTTAAPNVEISITPEVPAVTAAAGSKLFVNVSTTSRNVIDVGTTRVGVDLVAILDKSGSMTGEKEALLREALGFVINELDSQDRLCTIAFDSNAHYEHGLLRMTEEGKSRAHAAARGPGLMASGGTCIYDGLRCGMGALNTRKVPNAVTTVFLLTDGIDDSNLMEKLEIARQIRANGWFLFIFAFGKDHNASHLNAIAEAAGSSYIFVEDLSTVREAFGGAIGSQKGVAGKLLTISVSALDEGVVFQRALSGQYASSISAFGRVATISYPNLLIGEKRDCCLEVILPAALPGADTNGLFEGAAVRATRVLSVTLTYSSVSTEGIDREVTVESAPLIIMRPERISAPLARDSGVDSQINRINVIETIERATSLADQGHLLEARQLVESARVSLMSSASREHHSTISMVAELDQCFRRVIREQHGWTSVDLSV